MLVDKIKKNLKYIKVKDLLKCMILLLALPLALVVRIKNKVLGQRIWLVSEKPDTARDNGYRFYEYVAKNQLGDGVYYVIDKRCKDYEKVKDYGNIISFGSLRHWIYYLAADRQISNHKDSNPLPFLFYVLHVYLNMFNHRVFLQHGITKDDSEWIYYKNTKFKMFICGAKKEYDYIKERFGYPAGAVQYSGFARFDVLNDAVADKKKVLIMPTWRNWLGRETNGTVKKEKFDNTKYYKHWMEVLNNERLSKYLEKNNIDVYFYQHIGMRDYVDCFHGGKRIKIVKDFSTDIQKMLMESALLVTDYSSVFMDFAYMQKPVIYYQFDYDDYRKNHYEQGYFDYNRDGFGKVYQDVDDVVEKMIQYMDSDYKVEQEYLKKMSDFFSKKDNKNCERIYRAIEEME